MRSLGLAATEESLGVVEFEDRRSFLISLRQRELAGVQLVISDQHSGLVAALGRAFQGVAHQRCRVHFARNLLSHIPNGHAGHVASTFLMTFAQAKPADVHAGRDQTREEFRCQVAQDRALDG